MDDLQDLTQVFVLENKKGSYKDFGLKHPGDYPLPGVSFYADYGYLPGYVGEDGHDLDFFLGDNVEGAHGYFLVWRTQEVLQEHKFFLAMNDEQLAKTLKEYSPVVVGGIVYLTIEEMLERIKGFKA